MYITAAIYLFLLLLSLYLIFNRNRIVGAMGEKKVSFLMRRLNNHYKIYNDLLIKTPNGSIQIDHVVVSIYGVFVIETKNHKGWIFGSENSFKWTQSLYGSKYELYNPIWQNKSHINTLRKILPNFSPDQFISIIVFPRKTKLKVQGKRKNNVVSFYRLVPKIRSYKETILTERQVNEICKRLDPFVSYTRKEKKEHVKFVKEKARKSDALRKAGICPLCGGELIKRDGQYGTFYGCSNFPKCKFTTK